VWLRRVEELSQKDVAARLGITEKTVEKHIAKGMRLLAEQWFGGIASAEMLAAVVDQRDERRHAD
jgi:RNA polymerase sigma-70 factor (ECF subfamily)